MNIDVTLTDSVEAHEALRTKGYDEHRNKFLDVKTGDDSFHEDAEWNNVTQIVDRRERQYKKKIVRESTGEVLRDEDVPLDQREPPHQA